MTRYQVIEGLHVERKDGEPGGTILIPKGSVFESEHDWYADKWPNKFRKVDDRSPEGKEQVWNPKKETLDSFVNRMRSTHAEIAAHPTAPPLRVPVSSTAEQPEAPNTASAQPSPPTSTVATGEQQPTSPVPRPLEELNQPTEPFNP